MSFAEMPVAWANYLSMFGFLLLAALVWTIPAKTVLTEAPDGSRWRDLRIWATALIAMQLGIYALFT